VIFSLFCTIKNNSAFFASRMRTIPTIHQKLLLCFIPPKRLPSHYRWLARCLPEVFLILVFPPATSLFMRCSDLDPNSLPYHQTSRTGNIVFCTSSAFCSSGTNKAGGHLAFMRFASDKDGGCRGDSGFSLHRLDMCSSGDSASGR
jgi:hypothetical protein